MLRSLYSGISGLRSHQTMLDVTGNNIANVNTTAFKSSAVRFQDTLSQMTQGAGASSEIQGGTNPAQIVSACRSRASRPTSGQGFDPVDRQGDRHDALGRRLLRRPARRRDPVHPLGCVRLRRVGRLVTTDGAVVLGLAGRQRRRAVVG